MIGLVSAGLLSVGCSSSEQQHHGHWRQQRHRHGRLAHGRQHRLGRQQLGHRRQRHDGHRRRRGRQRARTGGNGHDLTLRRWRVTFEQRSAEVAALGFDETFRRMWSLYLAYSEAGFRTGYLDVQQLTLTKR